LGQRRVVKAGEHSRQGGRGKGPEIEEAPFAKEAKEKAGASARGENNAGKGLKQGVLPQEEPAAFEKTNFGRKAQVLKNEK